MSAVSAVAAILTAYAIYRYERRYYFAGRRDGKKVAKNLGKHIFSEMKGSIDGRLEKGMDALEKRALKDIIERRYEKLEKLQNEIKDLENQRNETISRMQSSQEVSIPKAQSLAEEKKHLDEEISHLTNEISAIRNENGESAKRVVALRANLEKEITQSSGKTSQKKKVASLWSPELYKKLSDYGSKFFHSFGWILLFVVPAGLMWMDFQFSEKVIEQVLLWSGSSNVHDDATWYTWGLFLSLLIFFHVAWAAGHKGGGKVLRNVSFLLAGATLVTSVVMYLLSSVPGYGNLVSIAVSILSVPFAAMAAVTSDWLIHKAGMDLLSPLFLILLVIALPIILTTDLVKTIVSWFWRGAGSIARNSRERGEREKAMKPIKDQIRRLERDLRASKQMELRLTAQKSGLIAEMKKLEARGSQIADETMKNQARYSIATIDLSNFSQTARIDALKKKIENIEYQVDQLHRGCRRGIIEGFKIDESAKSGNMVTAIVGFLGAIVLVVTVVLMMNLTSTTTIALG